MQNRYQQLGLGGQAATPTTPGAFLTGSTPFMMDVGETPSLTGGIPAEFQAVMGQLQNAALSNPSGGAGGGKGGGKSAAGAGLSALGALGGK
jgi:hypothetical protein